ncbi:hypothetical protein Vadar_021830 [Vaccinium darrowii]|uniref:Uncharacterized protein n=1 Tax=Vaccinium darrowii TaxID=229202 RepID=A0ACB7YY82_9ERIC|nr:hypothetical protein Vadar_021830 [Vaccinium darrowii]
MGVRKEEKDGLFIVKIVILICFQSVFWKKTRQLKGITKMVWRKGRQPRKGGFAMEMSVTKHKKEYLRASFGARKNSIKEKDDRRKEEEEKEDIDEEDEKDQEEVWVYVCTCVILLVPRFDLSFPMNVIYFFKMREEDEDEVNGHNEDEDVDVNEDEDSNNGRIPYSRFISTAVGDQTEGSNGFGALPNQVEIPAGPNTRRVNNRVSFCSDLERVKEEETVRFLLQPKGCDLGFPLLQRTKGIRALLQASKER